MVTCSPRPRRPVSNLAGRRIAPVVLGTPQWTVVKLHLEKIAAAVTAATPGSYTEVKFEPLTTK